jgi:HEAT repeat protein
VAALEAIAPGTPPVREAHFKALHDTDPAVRKAGATYSKVPADDPVVAALVTALGDQNDDVRRAVAGSLATILFEHPAVVPALLKALRADTQRKNVVDALAEHFESTSDSAEFRRVRGDLSRLRTVLAAAIPGLEESHSLKNTEIGPTVFNLLGRIVSFSRMSRDADLRKTVEPALAIYVQGLKESDPAVIKAVLGRLSGIPIRRAEIASALQKFLERTDLAPKDRETAEAALKAQTTLTASEPKMRSSSE